MAVAQVGRAQAAVLAPLAAHRIDSDGRRPPGVPQARFAAGAAGPLRQVAARRSSSLAQVLEAGAAATVLPWLGRRGGRLLLAGVLGPRPRCAERREHPAGAATQDSAGGYGGRGRALTLCDGQVVVFSAGKFRTRALCYGPNCDPT